MNEISPGQTYTQHRKISNSFRDKCLLQIFNISLSGLNELYQNPSGIEGNRFHFMIEQIDSISIVGQLELLREQALELAFKCLSYDFIGTSPEESQDDVGTVQIPSSWKSLFEDDNTIKLFLSIYKVSRPPHSVLVYAVIIIQCNTITILINIDYIGYEMFGANCIH
jgi:exportin-7